ncbi:hypothetical protein [Clavibacter michiganensis]|uniref:hypothetical protein n=1 Tax=Clavibacter michiganensis TaxID=28447 RepID=UPI0013FD975E|nr:hypothetical protein [Clavibacter michiganensis]
MRIYNTIEEFKTAENAPASREDEQTTTAEADWGYRLRGAGVPGGNEHGWLLTFLMAERPGVGGIAGSGWLIAYEIMGARKTGRIALLRRDWTAEIDQAEIRRTRAEAWWGGAAQRNTIGEADLETVDYELAASML